MSGSARAWQPSLLDTEALDHAPAVLYVVAVFHGGSAGREEHDRSLPMLRLILHALQVTSTPPARPEPIKGERRSVSRIHANFLFC